MTDNISVKDKCGITIQEIFYKAVADVISNARTLKEEGTYLDERLTYTALYIWITLPETLKKGEAVFFIAEDKVHLKNFMPYECRPIYEVFDELRNLRTSVSIAAPLFFCRNLNLNTLKEEVQKFECVSESLEDYRNHIEGDYQPIIDTTNKAVVS